MLSIFVPSLWIGQSPLCPHNSYNQHCQCLSFRCLRIWVTCRQVLSEEEWPKNRAYRRGRKDQAHQTVRRDLVHRMGQRVQVQLVVPVSQAEQQRREGLVVQVCLPLVAVPQLWSCGLESTRQSSLSPRRL